MANTRARTKHKARVQRTDQALILRRFRYGETSLLVHALTPHFGRIAVVAKGAYRLRSGYFGVLDLFDTLELSWRASGELGTLSKARIVNRRRALSSDLGRYRAALSGLELTGLGARDDFAEPALFAELQSFLDLLHTCTLDPELCLIAFDLAWLAQAGLSPSFENCASCGRTSRTQKRLAQAFFSHARGGLLCSSCRRHPELGKSTPGRHRSTRQGPVEHIDALPWEVVQSAQELAETPLSELARASAKLSLRPKHIPALGSMVAGFLEYHLERRLKSRRQRRPGTRSGVRVPRD